MICVENDLGLGEMPDAYKADRLLDPTNSTLPIDGEKIFVALRLCCAREQKEQISNDMLARKILELYPEIERSRKSVIGPLKSVKNSLSKIFNSYLIPAGKAGKVTIGREVFFFERRGR